MKPKHPVTSSARHKIGYLHPATIDPALVNPPHHFSDAALKFKLPTILFFKPIARVGGLTTYGANQETYFPRAVVMPHERYRSTKSLAPHLPGQTHLDWLFFPVGPDFYILPAALAAFHPPSERGHRYFVGVVVSAEHRLMPALWVETMHGEPAHT